MLETIINITLTAGKILSEGYFTPIKVDFKNTIDLVTEYDKKIERYLIDELKKNFPDKKIVSEEYNTDASYDDRGSFFIDPIDGTTNFVHRFPFCAVSVGYISKNTRCGVVYNPILDELFFAETGKGAFCNQTEIRVSSESELINTLIATGFPYSIVNTDKRFLMEMLGAVLKNSRGIRRAGSASLDLCYVAKGVFGGYYESSLKPWDVAAGVVILEEAGGKVSGRFGEVFDLWSDFIVATNGHIHNKLLRVLNG
ncbi:inositol monophosphatase family protein [Calditerrivibrio nitroreducens]|uniref:Inositol-1-monophosphatase n=1 Tax=Calditerrivibrio nitroreducens (strain DSM 19672 / NBRC 101217 / Yu37-1) TaxID=768670 RepID=E4TJB1_CALNY|nr:inositol monophosphatase family protein [Calditerrivibrio nitroreducens]ADR19178.1 inositol monophosphatase [Calditerrivibrio nitroreducens DSM 19672]